MYGNTGNYYIATNNLRGVKAHEINNSCNKICVKFVAYYGSSTGTSYSPGDVLNSADVPGAVNLTIEENNSVFVSCGACEADL